MMETRSRKFPEARLPWLPVFTRIQVVGCRREVTTALVILPLPLGPVAGPWVSSSGCNSADRRERPAAEPMGRLDRKYR